ncbi:unnamed protein product [Spodoptera littoralis]|uniref:Cytochrome b561 domain-containing protein n=1 Tax=Spodoptera littoralis TaxID=7109 RepID=A0A9P0N0M7_SPOLI|nr:unnamed protein product [Spodoptera littoralis]CAH1640266.1 unnamed protein product [Spodoptera littoralis]
MGKPPNSSYVVCMNVMNTVTHVLMGGVAFFGIVIGDVLPEFTAHSYFAVIGLTILCSQAIMSVNPYKAYNENFKFPKKSKTFWIVQIVGCIVVFVGACLGIAGVSSLTISVGPIQASVKHFSTSHGIIGLMVMLLVSVKLLGAIGNLLLSERFNNLMKTIYVIVSIVTISLAYLAICVKYGDIHDHYWSEPSWAIAFTVFTMLSVWSMTGARVFMTGSINNE